VRDKLVSTSYRQLYWPGVIVETPCILGGAKLRKIISFLLIIVVLNGSTPIHAYANDDRQIYLNYLASGRWRSDGEQYPLDNNVVITSTCMVDLDGDGTYELLISAAQGIGYSDTTHTKFFTIQNGQVKAVISAWHLHSSGSPGATNRITFMYNKSTQRYVLAEVYSQNAWGLYGDGLIIYDYSNGNATVKTEISNVADNGALDKKEYFINGNRTTKDEYESIRNNYVDPPDLAYKLTEVTANNLIPNVPTQNQISVRLNGRAIDFDQPPIIENGRTLVPLRLIFEAMGASVDWNASTQRVTARLNNTTISMQIGNKTMSRNNQNIELDVPPKLVNGRTLIPVRAVAESFGASVNWDGDYPNSNNYNGE